MFIITKHKNISKGQLPAIEHLIWAASINGEWKISLTTTQGTNLASKAGKCTPESITDRETFTIGNDKEQQSSSFSQSNESTFWRRYRAKQLHYRDDQS